MVGRWAGLEGPPNSVAGDRFVSGGPTVNGVGDRRVPLVATPDRQEPREKEMWDAHSRNSSP